MKPKKLFAPLALFLAGAGLLLPAAAAQEAPRVVEGKTDRSTPRKAVFSFLWWLQTRPGQWRPDLAAQCLALPPSEAPEQGEDLAVKLKRWLDTKLYVDPDSIPDDPGYVDPKEEKPAYWLSAKDELRQVYLIKSGDLWLFSAETVGAIPDLYEKAFPPLVDFVYDHLPDEFRWEIPILRLKIWQLLGIPLLILIAYLAGRFARWILEHPVRRVVSKTQTNWDDLLIQAVSKPLGLLVVSGFLASTFHLLMIYQINRPAEVLFGVLATISLVWAGYRVSEAAVGEMTRRAERTPGRIDDHLVPLARIGLRVVVFSLGIVLVLDSFGINVATLVAGLGIGGLAVALAAQNILGDLFASVSIALDKPFIVGDFVIFGDFMGTVEYVGLKTTRVRSLSGEQLVVSNADLIKSPIRNFKRMQERRAVFTFGVIYQTPYEKLAAIPGFVKEIVQATPQTRFDRANFQKYGDSSLDFEIVYWVLSPDYNVFADIHQSVLFALFRRFQKEGIDFAYPTRTLFVEKADEPKAAGR